MIKTRYTNHGGDNMEWRDIVGWEGFYQISENGLIKSLPRKHNPNERIRKTNINKCGYERVALSKNSKNYYYSVHRLLAEAFVPNPNNYPCINHKDENKTNNHYTNLEWCTHHYNNNYNNRYKTVSESLKKYYKRVGGKLNNSNRDDKGRFVKKQGGK